MKKNIAAIIIILLVFINIVKSEDKITIELQIENEILTNVDFLNEKNYLIALNNNLKSIPKNQLKQLARDSLIREKIKKIELSKFYELNKKSKYMDQILEDFYKRLNFSSDKEFHLYLKKYNLNLTDIKEKLKIETLWNELIYKRFNAQINIDEEKLKKKLSLQKNLLTEYSLGEILFELSSSEVLEKKYNLILKNIKESGFKSSAAIFSISESSKFGGDLGWINETQLNEVLLKEIKSINVNELTKPIQATNGYLILKLNNKRQNEVKINFEKTLKQMINKEKNRQLNQFSLIYYNKTKQSIFISEK
jgi:peptidyl-prolyl cis-trans isomerase SurA